MRQYLIFVGPQGCWGTSVCPYSTDAIQSHIYVKAALQRQLPAKDSEVLHSGGNNAAGAIALITDHTADWLTSWQAR